ncbi:MAG: ribosome silencing factor [Eubacteriales bacterium]|nr:ribosome silencing factor [Eubacteriales bacterium]
MEGKELAIKIAKILYDKKALDIDVLEVQHRTVITDFMVIASGRSYPQVRSLMDEVEDQLAKENLFPNKKEGMQEARWGVLDYNYVMVHIFHKQDRDHYKLDALWSDAKNKIDPGFENDEE